MDRDEFMELVYETFADEPDNVLANGIIEAADAYVEHEKAQLSNEDATKDATSELISRQEAIDAVMEYGAIWMEYTDAMDKGEIAQRALNNAKSTMIRILKELPTIQPETPCYLGSPCEYQNPNVEISQPEPQWIPCSERMPEPRIDVWVNSDLGQMIGYYDETIELWYGRNYLELIVNAWMPLPEPYKPNNK